MHGHDARFRLQGPRSTRHDQDALRVLHWLDSHVRPQLPTDLQHEYARARQARGPRRLGTARMYGNVRVSGMRLPVTGTGDEAHALTRLERLVRDVFVPLALLEEYMQICRDLQQRLRGIDVQGYHLLDRALAKTRRKL